MFYILDLFLSSGGMVWSSKGSLFWWMYVSLLCTMFLPANRNWCSCSALSGQLELVRNLVAHSDAGEGKWRGNWRMEWVASILTPPPNVDYPALLKLMCTPQLPAVDWTDAPTDLNGLVRFGERGNLVSARVPSRSTRAILCVVVYWRCCWQPVAIPVWHPLEPVWAIVVLVEMLCISELSDVQCNWQAGCRTRTLLTLHMLCTVNHIASWVLYRCICCVLWTILQAWCHTGAHVVYREPNCKLGIVPVHMLCTVNHVASWVPYRYFIDTVPYSYFYLFHICIAFRVFNNSKNNINYNIHVFCPCTLLGLQIVFPDLNHQVPKCIPAPSWIG